MRSKVGYTGYGSRQPSPPFSSQSAYEEKWRGWQRFRSRCGLASDDRGDREVDHGGRRDAKAPGQSPEVDDVQIYRGERMSRSRRARRTALASSSRQEVEFLVGISGWPARRR
jgi:hypothetical protein